MGPSSTHDVPTAPAEQRRGIAPAIIAGLIAGAPSAVLLAYLAALPFMLGLFFFLLVGLLVGAVMFRFARPGSPLTRRQVRLATTLIVAEIWVGSIYAEYRALYATAEKQVQRSVGYLKPPEKAELSRSVTQGIDAHLARLAPGGGLPGYVRWVLSSGTMELQRPSKAGTVRVQLGWRRFGWALRTCLSLALLSWAAFAQLAPLTRPPAEPDGPTQAPDPPELADGPR